MKVPASSNIISISIESLFVQKPQTHTSATLQSTVMRRILPHECRRTGASYQGLLFGSFSVQINDEPPILLPSQKIARIPVMVASTVCHLHGKSRTALIALGEEEFEVGGTFIANGSEKVVRMITVPRSNHAISAKRSKNASRGPLFTDLSVSYRSMRKDLTTFTMHFHYLQSGAVRARISIKRNEYFIPVGILLRAFMPSGTTDRELYELLVGGERDNGRLGTTAVAIVKELSERYPSFRIRDAEPDVPPSTSKYAATAYLGRNFSAVIGLDEDVVSDHTAGESFLRQYVLVHLSTGAMEASDPSLDRSKADTLVLIVRKLVATWSGEIETDDADAPSHLSVMTPGQLYLGTLKDRLEALIRVAAAYIRRESEKEPTSRRVDVEDPLRLVKDGLAKALRSDLVTSHMSYLMATGNLRTESGLDLPQAVGYAVMAERINYLRFLAHFRAIHKGAFYASMRSVKVRKLLPEGWGFICPVHTPDGDPCGILNHLAANVIVTVGTTVDSSEIINLFSDFNFTPAPALSSIHSSSPTGTIPVVVDGRVLGFVEESCAREVADQVRFSKVRFAVKVLPFTCEVALILPSEAGSGFQPGIFVHTGGGRLLRPVRWLKAPKKSIRDNRDGKDGLEEYIGTLEQVFLRVRPSSRSKDPTGGTFETRTASHAEISPWSFLSVLASLSPFPDMNQGPRNMFQCQMAKQAMGTPCHTIWSRTESKVYRHTTPQVPITRNACMQDPLGADVFPNGVNAVVAVLSYTGNDMEDALIINKASLDRGFAHGTVYVNQRVDLDDNLSGRDTKFAELTSEEIVPMGTVDSDGLPAVGSRVTLGSPLYGTCKTHFSGGSENCEWKKYKSVEDGTVDEVIVYDSDFYKGTRTFRGDGIREGNIRIRVSRRPSVGDKFASRAGQKGTMSAAWPVEDMPFTESGITPDILFNPNGFPSRMTIGMMVEIMSGKAGALHGIFNDSSPFQFDENHRAVDFFAEQLLRAGYDYSGSETLYSGYTGEPFEVQVFTGIVHYQRLRHMVSDKFQVRTTGAVHPLFRQPIKGRKKGGAIRFGEMERDGLLAHGASFLLRDRLALASDMHLLHVCQTCGSLLTPVHSPKEDAENRISCRNCNRAPGSRAQIAKVAMPYSFKYLANELAAMNVRVTLGLGECL